MISDFPARLILKNSAPYQVERVRENLDTPSRDEDGEPVEQIFVAGTVLLHIQNPQQIDLENVDAERETIVKVAYSAEKLDPKDKVIINDKRYSIEGHKPFTDNQVRAYRYVIVHHSEDED
jgi:SPP1 family predicted phage head-tail adaptor